jgi:CzcA family heavy metal efflux pump
MMRWIVGSSLRFRVLVLAFAVGMVGVAVGQFREAKVDVFPEFAPPRVEVQTPALGLSTTEVEALVTVPLEQELQTVPDLVELRSKSIPQLSTIEMIFEPGADLLVARQRVQERLQSVHATLPSWALSPIMIQPLSATSRVLKIGISSETLSLMDLSMVAYWTIRPRLLQVPGVANVPIWGERIKMLQIQVDPERMAAHDVSLNQVMETSSDAMDAGLLSFASGAVIGTGGYLDTPNQRLPIEHVLPFTSPKTLSRVVIQKRPAGPVVIGDVADLVYDHQPLLGDAVINDGPGLMIIVEKLPWANTLEVTRGIDKALAELAPGLSGIEIDSHIFRPASFIEMAIDNLTDALVLGSLLVILVLAIFLFEWRTALISIAAIPLSLTAAWLVLHWQGSTVNTMLLAGFVIAIGVVVDDAIIDIENIVRRIREHRRAGSTVPTARIVVDASVEVRAPIIYATLIVIVAVAPVFFLTGLSGSFFRPLTIAYTLAVLASLAVALTVIPAMALIMLRKAPLERRDPPVVTWLQRGYRPVLAKILASPRRAYSAVAVVALVGVGVLPGLGQSLLPEFKERDFLMHWLTEPSTSHPEMIRITEAVSRELRAIPGVRNFGAHIGQAFDGDEPYGIYFTENWISVDPEVDYDQTVAQIEDVVHGYPGLHRDVQTYLQERVREVLTGAGKAIVVRLYGEDIDTLRDRAQEISGVLDEIDGIVEAEVDLAVDIPQINIEVDLAAARRYGVKPGDVRRAAATMVNQEEIGDIYRSGRTYDVMVTSTPQTRRDLMALQNLPIDTPSGDRVRMRDLAQVSIVPTPNQVEHDGTLRKIDVTADVGDRDIGSAVQELERRLKAVELPQGYHASVLGEYAEREEAQNRLFLLGVGAGIAILLLLQQSFGTWRLTIMSSVLLPSALVGGLLAAYVGGGVISLGSLVGFFTVFGIAARNGILMISHFQHLEREEGEPFGPGLVLRGAGERLAPILMTTLSTALALVPMAVLGDVPGNEIEHPMAVVILGGLVTSTLLNLFVAPALYLRFAKPLSSRLLPRERSLA